MEDFISTFKIKMNYMILRVGRFLAKYFAKWEKIIAESSSKNAVLNKIIQSHLAEKNIKK